MTIAWEARCCGARPSSGTYLASENISRETSAAESEEARAGVEKTYEAC